MGAKQLALAALAILIIGGAIGYLGFKQSGRKTGLNLTPLETAGEMIARETAGLINHSGQVVVVVASPEGTPTPALESQLKGFKAGLARNAGVTLKAIKQFKRAEGEDGQRWPPRQAARLAGLGDGAAALVLFVDLPQSLTAEDIAALANSKSKVVFVGGFTPAVRPLLAQGGARMVIVSRFPPPAAPAGTETPEQWFKRLYIVARPDALGELP